MSDLLNLWARSGVRFGITIPIEKTGYENPKYKKQGGGDMGMIEKLKLLFKARKPLTDLVNEAKEFKSGYKTVSFWMTILGTLGALLAALNGAMPPVAFVIASTALAVLYNIARGLAKADQVGVKPVLQSTEFWVGVLSALSAGIVSLQQGGVNPAWIVTAQTLIASVMAFAQNLAGNQPEPK